MTPWVYAVGAAVALAAGLAAGLAAAAVARAGRRDRAELQRELLAARADVLSLTRRIEALAAEIARTRRAAEERETGGGRASAPFVITGLVPAATGDPVSPRSSGRDAHFVHVVETSRPVWVPAKPLREALVKTLSVGHGVRRAMSAESRDQILLEMRAEVRRSRRRRKAELKQLRKQLRAQKNRAA